MSLRIELIDTPSEFAAVSEEWNAALSRSGGGSVFLTHQWLSGSWSFLSATRKLRVLVLRDGARFAGALPLALETQRWRPSPVRCLVFLTDPITGSVRSDLMVDTDADEAVSICASFLRETRTEWDVGIFDSMPAESPLVRRYGSFCAAGGLHGQPLEEYLRLHYLPVAGTWEEYMQSHSQHSREHLRRERAKLERLGRVSSEFATTQDAVLEAVKTFFALEKKSAKQGRADYTPLDTRLSSYFHTQFHGLAAAGLALVATLRLDGAPIASILATRYRGVIHTLNDVYDPQSAKGYPGHYLRGDLLRHAWQHGYREVDFNGYGSHLQRWRTVARPHYRAIFYSPSAYGRLQSIFRLRLIPFARRVLPSRWLPSPPPTRPGDRGLAT